MSVNFFKDRDNNGGRNSYWKDIDSLCLNEADKKVVAFIRKAEQRYEDICFEPRERLSFETLRNSLTQVQLPVLKALTKCCVMTAIFVPIKQILCDWHEIPVSKRVALWEGTGFKAHHAFVQGLLNETLAKPVTSADLFETLQPLACKGFDLKAYYLSSLNAKAHVWYENSPKAEIFKQKAAAHDPLLAKALRQKGLLKCLVVTHQNQPVYAACDRQMIKN